MMKWLKNHETLKCLRRVLYALGVLVLVSMLWIFRPYASPDEDAVDSSLAELQEPYQSVYIAYFMDGGSLGVRIRDAQGRAAYFCLRSAMGDGEQRYKRLYRGAMHYSEGSAEEIHQPSDTILKILDILRAEDVVCQELDIGVASASGRWRDYAKIPWRKWVTRQYK